MFYFGLFSDVLSIFVDFLLFCIKLSMYFVTYHSNKSVGLSGLEPPTSRLSGVRSNRLSYKPIEIRQPPALPHRLQCSTIGRPGLNHRVRDENGCDPRAHRHQECVRLRFLTNICLASPRKRRRVIRDLPTSWAPPYDIP